MRFSRSAAPPVTLVPPDPNFRRLAETLIVMLSVPFPPVGGMIASTVLMLDVIPAL